jgi:hypothetical protein
MNTNLKNSAFDKLKLAPIALAAGAGMMLAAAAPGQAAVVSLGQTVIQGGVTYYILTSFPVQQEALPMASLLRLLTAGETMPLTALLASPSTVQPSISPIPRWI